MQGLFNPDTVTMDYDTKIISVGNEYKYKVGDIFQWVNTETFWIVYTQEKTELAYFRGKCRRCNYKVQWVNGERQVLETYMSVIGPSSADYSTYHHNNKVSVDAPTADLIVLIPNNNQNRHYFNQYQSFILHGITWKVTQYDDLSMEGIIQLNCRQDNSNLIEDDVEGDLKNRWNIHPVVPEYPTEYGIEGKQAIKPLFKEVFKAITLGGEWYVAENKTLPQSKQLPIKFVEVKDNIIVVLWDSTKSGSFTLCYKHEDITYKKFVVVESLL